MDSKQFELEEAKNSWIIGFAGINWSAEALFGQFYWAWPNGLEQRFF